MATEKDIPFDDIKRILWKLQRSSIPRSKLIRLEILLNDIFENRYCVTNIVNRMDYDKDASYALKRLSEKD